MRASEFVEGLKETGETVYAAAMHQLPALLEVELNIAAPIFHFDTLAAGTVSVHLGTFYFKTDGPCPYNSMRAELQLNETRLLCAPKDGGEVSLLRPIPIRVQVAVTELRKFSLDVSFKEIFLEATPEAVALLLAVPVSMAQSIVGLGGGADDAHAALRTTAAAQKRVLSRTDTESAIMDLKGISEALQRNAPTGNRSMSTDSNKEQRKSFEVESVWRFERCGFIVHPSSSSRSGSSSSNRGVLQAELSGLVVTMAADAAGGTCTASISLQEAFVSDPSLDALLFQSIKKVVS